jgi:hypothetical protein
MSAAIQFHNNFRGKIMRKLIVSIAAIAGFSQAAFAQELTWRKDIQPIIKAQCGDCHGANEPEFAEWMVVREKNKKASPRMDTYAHFMGYVVWPATGAMMRRLDDGKGSAEGKPGNMYRHLGGSDAERAKNLATIKAWMGEGAWNLNRWEARGNTPGMTKEQIDKIKAKY